MSKTVPADFTASEVQLFLAVKLEFDSGDVLLWNGYGDAIIGGETYIGAGDLIEISDVEETGEVAARGISIALNGLDTGLVATALAENYQNRPVTLLFGAIQSGVFSSTTLFKGRMDVMTINESADTASIQLTAENRLIDLSRPRSYRYTSEDQKIYYPNDKGLDYVSDLQDKQLFWGRANP